MWWALRACQGKPAADTALPIEISDSDAPVEDTGTPVVDADGDGSPADVDCDDTDPAVHPSAEETCDGQDQDCDELVDEGVTVEGYVDQDGDGFGDQAIVACEDELVVEGGDCDDEDATVFPYAEELCGDLVDQDCDGEDQACPAWGSWSLSDASAILVAADKEENAAHSVLVPGDLDGDGRQDLLVSGHSADREGVRDVGGLYQVLGSAMSDAMATGSLASVPRWWGTEPDANAGSWLWGGGDVDGDGLPDYLVSAPYLDQAGEDAGGVYVVTTVLAEDAYLPAAHALLLGEAEDDSAGQSAAITSDLDGDGHADVLVGADDESSIDTNQGAVYVWRGPVEPGTWSLTDADAKLVGQDNNTYMIDAEHAGVRVATLDDIDGDGLADFAIGASDYWPGDTDDVTGAAYVVTGWVEGTVSLADADHFFMSRDTVEAGFGLASPGDVDGDGTGDLAIGSLGDSAYLDHAGAMFYFSGTRITSGGSNIDLQDAGAIFYGAREGAKLGYAISTAGDLYGNGFDDVLVSAPDDSAVADEAGAIYLVYGPLDGRADIDDVASATFTGEPADDESAGKTIDGGFDLDGDGLLDFVTGAPKNDRGGDYAGAAYLLLGGDFL